MNNPGYSLPGCVNLPNSETGLYSGVYPGCVPFCVYSGVYPVYASIVLLTWESCWGESLPVSRVIPVSLLGEVLSLVQQCFMCRCNAGFKPVSLLVGKFLSQVNSRFTVGQFCSYLCTCAFCTGFPCLFLPIPRFTVGQLPLLPSLSRFTVGHSLGYTRSDNLPE